MEETAQTLYNACLSGNSQEVKSLISRSSDTKKFLHFSDPQSGNTCLHVAVSNGPLDIVRSLISAKADPNSVNIEGETPLHMLAHETRVTMRAVMIADALVKAGTLLTVKNKDDKTAFELFKSHQPDVAGPLLPELLNIVQFDATINNPNTLLSIKRSDSLKKLLTLTLPDQRRPVPYRECSPRAKTSRETVVTDKNVISTPSTPPPPQPEKVEPSKPPKDDSPIEKQSLDLRYSNPPKDGEYMKENAKLKAENEALRDELERIRMIVNQLNPRKQLKLLYARLVQLESIQSVLENIDL